MGGGPRGRNVISTEGNARALHFSPTSTGLRSGQFSRHNSDFSASPYVYILEILQLVMKIFCRAGGNNTRPCCRDYQELSVFSVQQQQRAVSAAEEFCVQIHAIKLAINPSKSNYHECVRGK